MSQASTLAEVARERQRQDAKWGEQNHPDGTGPDVRLRWGADTYAGAAQVCRKLCQSAAADGANTFAGILLEEVFEGLAESDPKALRTELVQVAAVAVAWIEAIDRRDGETG